MNNEFEEKHDEELIDEHYNSRLVNVLDENLLDYSKILELGSGTGADLVKLSKNYDVTGSDISPAIVRDIKERYPEIKVRVLDVREMNIEGKFDCIYSNKVLSHLTKAELENSLIKQAQHLDEDGMILMTLNYGEYREEYLEEDGLLHSYYTESDISNLLPDSLRIDLLDPYSEEKKDDSLMVILRKRSD